MGVTKVRSRTHTITMSQLNEIAMQRVIDMNAYAALMRFAFEQVRDKDDWKAPVDCVVPWSAANLYGQAIEFMTACAPVYGQPYQLDGMNVVRITAAGYRAGPAGDH